MVKDRADAVEWELSHENSIEIRSLFLLNRQKRSDRGSSCNWRCGVGRLWRSEKHRTCPLRDDRREVVKAEALRWAESWATLCYEI
ncbi:hypothetical protein DY000_02004985 [Brassica cretica]|uniref:Uncharacterized protein n=1 Tax=Brassica cretica TaxID=69181 RepID=A0ABQ7BU78_BRACR|nr:hypothetical protein DY000_02060942 [Brassica cretica]KAF3542941.1 hypothetical protein DY000_02004985 [Brassica cretica]